MRRLFQLATPVMAAQLGTMAMSTVDTLMVARVGVAELAAAAIANAWIYGVLLACQGMIHGVAPIVTQAHGARRGDLAGLALQHALVVALVLSVPAGLALASTGPVLLALGQDPELAELAHAYTRVQVPGVPFLLLFLALRQYLQGRELVRPAMWVVGLANGFNLLANWALIFGHLGLPALGVVGAGVATTLTRAFMLLALVAMVWRLGLHRGAWVPLGRRALERAGLARVVAFGSPVAIQMALEVWAFSASTLIVGRLGAADLSGHSIVMNLASLSFMMPLGLSQGAVTRVGNLIGAGRRQAAQRAAWVALACGAGLMSSWAVLFVVARLGLPRLYTAEPAVVAAAASVLPVAAAFQIFDGTQVVGAGILRGMGRTRPAAWFNLVGWWVLALPLAAWLTLETGAGLQGVWWALCFGLAVVATAMVLWIRARGPAHEPLPVAGGPTMGHR
ncbi:MAG: MATE family efflux transporter [Myxococcota bacterium]